MSLGDLISALENADPAHVAPLGFGSPHSYRGDYHELAFKPAVNVTVASMLAHARSALGASFPGYKGGDFMMSSYTECFIDHAHAVGGDRIGPVLVAYMTGKAGASAASASTAEVQ